MEGVQFLVYSVLTVVFVQRLDSSFGPNLIHLNCMFVTIQLSHDYRPSLWTCLILFVGPSSFSLFSVMVKQVILFPPPPPGHVIISCLSKQHFLS